MSQDELGLWGMAWHDVTFTGLIDGKVVRTLKLRGRSGADCIANRTRYADPKGLRERRVRVIVRALDQAGYASAVS